MKIIITDPRDKYEGSISIDMTTDNGYKEFISFGAGEPEDNSLARDLSGALSIEDMLEAAYDAGKNAEALYIEHITEEE